MVLNVPNGLFGQSDVRETDLPQKSVTRYYAVNPAGWTPNNPDIDDVAITKSSAGASEDGKIFHCPVNLPHGAIVTNVIVYGNAGATAESWVLRKVDLTGIGTTTMASANFDSADSSIVGATIDNSNYTYGFNSTSMDTGDTIFGGTITYTIGVYEV